jgi:CheY-like chemotaxis protein
MAAKTRVLIADDDDNMREMIKRMIRDLVDRFFECSDGRQALGAYAMYRPDWVLMDIRMEGMDGLTATQQITTAWPCARVVIVTSYNDSSLRKAALRAGAREYVLKENLLELRSILEKAPPT